MQWAPGGQASGCEDLGRSREQRQRPASKQVHATGNRRYFAKLPLRLDQAACTRSRALRSSKVALWPRHGAVPHGMRGSCISASCCTAPLSPAPSTTAAAAPCVYTCSASLAAHSPCLVPPLCASSLLRATQQPCPPLPPLSRAFPEPPARLQAYSVHFCCFVQGLPSPRLLRARPLPAYTRVRAHACAPRHRLPDELWHPHFTQQLYVTLFKPLSPAHCAAG